MTKKCFKCDTIKPIDSFYKHPETADGRLNKCIECTKSDVRSAYHKDIKLSRHRGRKRQRYSKKEFSVIDTAS